MRYNPIPPLLTILELSIKIGNTLKSWNTQPFVDDYWFEQLTALVNQIYKPC